MMLIKLLIWKNEIFNFGYMKDYMRKVMEDAEEIIGTLMEV